MSTMMMPETVPVLKPDDFVVGPYEYGCRRCLLAWKHAFFGLPGAGAVGVDALFDCCKDAGVPDIMCCDEADTRANRRLAARIWGVFLERMGYTEDGPPMNLEDVP